MLCHNVMVNTLLGMRMKRFKAFYFCFDKVYYVLSTLLQNRFYKSALVYSKFCASIIVVKITYFVKDIFLALVHIHNGTTIKSETMSFVKGTPDRQCVKHQIEGS